MHYILFRESDCPSATQEYSRILQTHNSADRVAISSVKTRIELAECSLCCLVTRIVLLSRSVTAGNTPIS